MVEAVVGWLEAAIACDPTDHVAFETITKAIELTTAAATGAATPPVLLP